MADLIQMQFSRKIDQNDQNDKVLLAEYVATKSELAFSKIVERYSGQVYSTCFRVLGNSHSAEDATQSTFIVLAQRAATFRSDVILSGWLYKTSVYCARKIRKTLSRRSQYEKQVVAMSPDPQEIVWEDIRPQIDDALASLPDVQRDAVVLRYLNGLSERDAALQAGCPEKTLRTRAARAIVNLRAKFRGKGQIIPAFTLAIFLTKNTTEAVPTGLQTSINAVCFGKAVPSPVVLEIAKSVGHEMSIAGIKKGVLAAVACVALSIALVQVYQASVGRFDQGQISKLESADVVKLPDEMDFKTLTSAKPQQSNPIPHVTPGKILENDGKHLDDNSIWSILGSFPVRLEPTQWVVETNPQLGTNVGDEVESRRFAFIHHKWWDLGEGAVSIRFSIQSFKKDAHYIKAFFSLKSESDKKMQNEVGLLNCGYIQDFVTYKKAVNDKMPFLMLPWKVVSPGRHHYELIVSKTEVLSRIDDKKLFKGSHGINATQAQFVFTFESASPDQRIADTIVIEDVVMGPSSLLDPVKGGVGF